MFVKAGFRVFTQISEGMQAVFARRRPRTRGEMAREVTVETEKMMKIGKQLAIMHVVEAFIARRAAKKRGLKPMRYFCLTLMFGVFVLVPLLRKPKLGKEAKAVDI